MKRINKQQRVKISILISVLLLISAIFFIQGCTSLSGSNNSTDNNSAPPSAPTGLSVTSANQKITISWNTVEGATSYNLYYGTNSGINKETGTKVSQITSPFTLFDRIILQTLTTLTIMRDVSRKTKTGGVL